MKKAILRTLAYADVFDYPLTESEVRWFLISSEKVERERFDKRLKSISTDLKQISTDGKFYFLKGRGRIVALRNKRKRWSQGKLEVARQVATWLKLIPTIKMVAVTGALAMANSDKEDDIDLLIVTAKNKLWLTRLLTVGLVELVGQRRHPGDKKVKDKICLNMFLDEDHLAVPKKERDLFTAHEVCQLRPIWDRNETYRKFVEKNKWVKQYLPNWKSHYTSEVEVSSTSRKHLGGGGRGGRRESFSVFSAKGVPASGWWFLSFLIAPLEKLAYQCQLLYMSSRKTTEITEPGRIRFHPQDAREWVLEEYQKNLKELKIN